MISLVSGSNGLIGKAVTRHLWGAAQGYDLPQTTPPDVEYGAFIDCARYDDQRDQVLTWDLAIDHFKHTNGGRIILFSSIYGHKAPVFDIYPGTEIPTTPLKYAMEKAAVEQAARYLAEQLKPYGIQVNCIAPGGVRNGQSAAFYYAYTESGAPMILTDNIMPVIDMLLHDDNAVNGQVITTDGGWSL